MLQHLNFPLELIKYTIFLFCLRRPHKIKDIMLSSRSSSNLKFLIMKHLLLEDNNKQEGKRKEVGWQSPFNVPPWSLIVSPASNNQFLFFYIQQNYKVCVNMPSFYISFIIISAY